MSSEVLGDRPRPGGAAASDAEAASGSALPIAQVGGGLLLALALVAYAQVPIGSNDVDPVTYGGVQTRVESSAEIKARFEAVGGYEEE